MNTQRNDPSIIPPRWDEELYAKKPKIGKSLLFFVRYLHLDLLQDTSLPTACSRLLPAV